MAEECPENEVRANSEVLYKTFQGATLPDVT